LPDAVDRKAFQRVCLELLHDLSGTPRPSDADTVSFLCVLVPGAVPDPVVVVELARKAVQARPNMWEYRETLGAALFRAGRFEEATEQLAKAAADQGNGGSVETRFLLALVHQRLKHPADARAWLRKGQARMDRALAPAATGAGTKPPT